LFGPRREHARFCSARCRAAWNREKLGDPAPGANALHWSVAAMNDTAELLAGVATHDRPKAVTVIGDMVWWVTIVDATLVRNHPDTYDLLLATYPSWRRKRIEGTLGGLRFVRNRMREESGCRFFIGPSPDQESWWWMPVPEPPLSALPPRARTWEMTRYSSYCTHVAGHTTQQIFDQVTSFLNAAAGQALSESSAPE
jgi:hypothetical protein